MVLSLLTCTQPMQIGGSRTRNQPRVEPFQRLAWSTSQAPMYHSQPRSNFQVSLSTSLIPLTRILRLVLKLVFITFVPFVTSNQFSAKALTISSPAFLSLPGWTMPMPVCLASQTRIYLVYIESKEHLLVLSHVPNGGPAHLLPFETPSLASSLSSHSVQNCLPDFQVTPHHSSIIYFVPRSSVCSFECPPLFQCT